MMTISHVDPEWLAKEGQALGGKGAPKRPLLVGGSGLIGCNMVVLLANTPECEKIRILDKSTPLNQKILSDAGIDTTKVEFINHRLGTDSEEALAEAVDGVDCVFSMVTPHVQTGLEKDFFACNVYGVQSLVKACKAKSVPRLVYLSSIAATNHFVESINQSEEDPLPPWEEYHSPYDISKRKGEEATLRANGEDGLNSCAIRCCGVLSAPVDYTFSNMLMIDGIMSKPTGCAVLDFIDARDLVRGLLMAAKALEQNPAQIGGQVFFVSKGEAINAAQLASLAAQALGWWEVPIPTFVVKIAMMFAAVSYHFKRCCGFAVPGVPPHWFMAKAFYQQTCDNSKAQRLLGYEPKVPMKDTVERICKLYSKQKALQLQARPVRRVALVSVSSIGVLGFAFALATRLKAAA